MQLEFDFRQADTKNQRWIEVPIPGTTETCWLRFEDTGYPDELFDELRKNKTMRVACGPFPPS